MRVARSSRVLLLALLPVVLEAQERPFPYEIGRADVVLASTGALSAGLALALLNTVDTPTSLEIAALDRSSVNRFDRPATWNWSQDWQDTSDGARNGLVVATGLAIFIPVMLDARWAEAAILGVMVAETAALTYGVGNLMKVAAQRRRPYLYNDAFTVEERTELARESGDGNLSLPSGHTSVAFAAAAFLSTTYADLHGSTGTSKWIWASSLGVASLVGVARVEGGKHFPTDVLIGAAMGATIGHLVPRLHRMGGPPVDVVATRHLVGLRISF